MPLLPLFGNPAGGGGGGGGGNPPPSQGGFGGGPGTYTIPSGLSLKQKKAMAALLACAPCCLGSGSGSGSGGGGGIIPCCETTATTVSWEITGAGSGSCLTGTQAVDFGDCLIEPDDLNGVNCGSEALTTIGSGSVNVSCTDAGVTTTIRISLCCVEPVDAAPYYRLGMYVTVDSGAGAGNAQWCTNEFDIGDCDPFSIEKLNWIPYYTDGGLTGAVGSVVFT